MNVLNNIRNKLRERKGRKNEWKEWAVRGFTSPSPAEIKRTVLMRLGTANSTWIETGTFMGDTTALLATNSRKVYTIEPEDNLFSKAAQRFATHENVKVIHGLSESVFPSLLPTLEGHVNFWLDGHYSGGITHQGPSDCPVREELLQIENNLRRYSSVTVLIDDIRCFDPSNPVYKDYPDINYLIDWSRRNNLKWAIEHDILVMTSKNSEA